MSVLFSVWRENCKLFCRYKKLFSPVLRPSRALPMWSESSLHTVRGICCAWTILVCVCGLVKCYIHWVCMQMQCMAHFLCLRCVLCAQTWRGQLLLKPIEGKNVWLHWREDSSSSSSSYSWRPVQLRHKKDLLSSTSEVGSHLFIL